MQKVNTTEFVRYLKEHWKGRTCQMCGGGDWRIQAAVFQLVPYGDDRLVVGSPNIPVVPVICTQCGNTILISAKVAGLVDK
ncbi:MAG: hypothetical protein WC562_07825 [Dehalococcoidia bacterium]